ncbi:MAG: hypothetical protein A3A73_06020 [Omnitrophica bacterium RIFCSPLOWO2_01_FULL_50_24]|nr:MAG: hypothetical protein A3A73_06020 [Omnitrophica bacterium RIFCSPLOWO2_01_FULL_50_24]
MFDQTVTILENKKVNAEYYKLAFRSKELSRRVLPGQFVQVQVEAGPDPLLRRPFSYYRVMKSRIELLYEILGRGTQLLAEKKRGHHIKVLGPLGRPFSKNLHGKRRILVGGGVGVPPLVFLAEAVKREVRPLVFLIGCKSRAEVLPKRELSEIRGEVRYATNDGSYGKKGFATVLLRDLLKREDPKTLFIQTCGPRAMMEAVMTIAKRFGIEGEASVDERMACGIGVCLGCVVKTKSGFKTSCVEGPVFRFDEMEVGAGSPCHQKQVSYGT